MLFQVTLLADLIAMAATLWGAFYLFARGFPSLITLRAVIVLLLLSIFFLGAYDNLFHQVEGTAALRALLLILGLGTWYSLTYQLTSQRTRARLRWMAIVVYIFAGITAASLLVIQDAFVAEQGNNLYVAHVRIGFPYIVYGAFQIIIVLGILYNLLAEDRIGLTRQGKYFLVASLFPVFAISSGIIGLAITPQLPRILPDMLTFGGMFLLSISVARHQTMIERRTTIQDLPVSLITVLGLAGLYAYIALRWNFPLERIGAVVAFAVLTHSAYDLVREFLERLRIRNEGTFRRQLRQLENQSAGEEVFQTRLQEGLDLMCDTLNSSSGLIAVRRGENFAVVAAKDSAATGTQISSTVLLHEDISKFENEQLPEILWIAPAFEAQKQIAVVGIGKSKVKLDYSTADLDLLAEVAGKVGTFVERGKQVQAFLGNAMESFRPGGPRPPEPLPRVWYSYVVLHDAYVEGVPNREITARLYISEGTFNRTRRNAAKWIAGGIQTRRCFCHRI